MIRSVLQGGIRYFHTLFLTSGLPDRIALYLHSLEPTLWDAFEELTDFLGAHEYSFVGIPEFLQGRGPKRALITFDDNYRSWYEARDLFNRLDLRAIFYINTVVLGDRASVDDIEAYYDRIAHRGVRTPLSGDEIRALASDGHTIGSHSHSHFVLSRLPIEVAKREILQAKTVLETMIGRPVTDFSYPFGMRRHLSNELRRYCAHIRIGTIANGIPGMLHVGQKAHQLQRSPWDLRESAEYNSSLLAVDGRWFARLTGRSAVG